MKPQDLKAREPRLILEDYFNGRSRAYGVFLDRFGTLKRQFTVDIVGTFDGKTLTLTEDFLYDDGKTEQRVWNLRKLDDHRYEGAARGVVGTAVGEGYGNGLNLRYDFDLPLGSRTLRVQFNDWFFLQPDGVLMNRARVSKFGFLLGEALITFHREPIQVANALASAAAAAE